jgi:hypothetical protein
MGFCINSVGCGVVFRRSDVLVCDEVGCDQESDVGVRCNGGLL